MTEGQRAELQEALAALRKKLADPEGEKSKGNKADSRAGDQSTLEGIIRDISQPNIESSKPAKTEKPNDKSSKPAKTDDRSQKQIDEDAIKYNNSKKLIERITDQRLRKRP